MRDHVRDSTQMTKITIELPIYLKAELQLQGRRDGLGLSPFCSRLLNRAAASNLLDDSLRSTGFLYTKHRLTRAVTMDEARQVSKGMSPSIQTQQVS